MKFGTYVFTIGTGTLMGFLAVLGWRAYTQADTPAIPRTVEQLQARAFIAPISEVSYWPIRDFGLAEPTVDAGAAGVYDVAANRFLFAKNRDEKLPIASVTKLMSAVVVVESLPLDDIYIAAAEDLNVDGLGADLLKNERIKGFDLLQIMLIKSSNDAAITFAHAAAKRDIDFVARMNEKARQFGMFNSSFYDAAGLDKRSYSTVSDLTILAQKISTYPQIWQILRMPEADVRSADGSIIHHLISTNKLLGKIAGIIGGKTGYTEEAQGTMVLTVAINGNDDTIISVVLGSHSRFTDTKTLIDWAQKAHKWK